MIENEKIINEYNGLDLYINTLVNKKHFGKNILIVCGKNSFIKCGAQNLIKQRLHKNNIFYFNEFKKNPKIEDAKVGAKLARELNVTLILAIGGGSSIDTAKLIKIFMHNEGLEEAIAVGSAKNIKIPEVELFAIPTTAGSGSESTHFAVVYIGNDKYSIASPNIIPNTVILDGSLLKTGSQYLKACNVLDALSQAIESIWSVNSTSLSRYYSYEAIPLIIKYGAEYVSGKCKNKVLQEVITASNFAGKAINITKTTAPHAWSYAFTSRYGIPHGHAVWLTLPKIFQIHFNKAKETNDLIYSEILDLVENLGIKNPEESELYLSKFCKSLGVGIDFEELKIGFRDREKISREVNLERMKNNPFEFDQIDVAEIFKL